MSCLCPKLYDTCGEQHKKKCTNLAEVDADQVRAGVEDDREDEDDEVITIDIDDGESVCVKFITRPNKNIQIRI